jgi:signal transduction histidine kinase
VVIENAQLYAEAARRERWLAATAEITALLLGPTSQTEALQAVADRACEIARADVSAVSLRRGESLEVQVVSGGLADTGRVGRAFPMDDSLAGSVMTTGEPVILEDLSADSRATRSSFGSSGKGIGPVVVVPLRTGDGVVGVLSLGWQPERRGHFEHLDVQLPQRFAEQAALALEVARARRDHEKLVLFEDRDRIGRDLHDLVIQRLFAIGLGLQNTGRMAEDAEVEERVAQAVDDIDATIKDIRRTIYALNTGPESTELRTRLSEVVSRSSETLGYAPRLSMSGPIDSAPSEEVATHLVAVLGEALSNAARHSKANEVEVSIVVDDRVVLVVADNGIGVPDEMDRVGGLQNMRERAERMGGEFELSSSATGTTLTWAVPCMGGTRNG